MDSKTNKVIECLSDATARVSKEYGDGHSFNGLVVILERSDGMLHRIFVGLNTHEAIGIMETIKTRSIIGPCPFPTPQEKPDSDPPTPTPTDP